uniref:Putative ovule protein n=1 Tax=Solanum chacoense TaxID=4108 RepID=A0A0V0H820_SOLCH
MMPLQPVLVPLSKLPYKHIVILNSISKWTHRALRSTDVSSWPLLRNLFFCRFKIWKSKCSSMSVEVISEGAKTAL